MPSVYDAYSGSVQEIRIYAEISLVSQNYGANTSVVRMKLYMYRVSGSYHAWNGYTTSGWYKINGAQHNRNLAEYSYRPDVGKKTYLEGGDDFTIGHDGNGYATVSYQGYHNAANSPALETAQTGVGQYALPRIPQLAKVTTNSVSEITAYTARFNGNVTDNMGSGVTERGFVYGTSTNPTGNKTPVGSGNGSFSKVITGLDDNTTYYVRAYAVNTRGTSYGSNVSFTTLLGIRYGEIDGRGTSYAVIDFKTLKIASIDAQGTSNALFIYLKQIAQAPKKTFMYRVYDKDGNFLGVWNDVSSDFVLSQAINTFGSQVNVQLARKPDRASATQETIDTESDVAITTENDEELVNLTIIRETIGEGSDVDIYLYVEVYVYYGDFEQLITQSGEMYITEDGHEYLVGTGAPTGRPIFKGYIAEYTALYGKKNGINIVLRSHGTELKNRIFADPTGNTTVAYLNTDPSQIIRDVLDNSNTQISYTTDSIDDTGYSEDYTFNINDSASAIDQALKLSDENWYYLLDQSSNTLYFKRRTTTPDHTFTLGREIERIDLKLSMSQLINQVYYIGGIPDGETEKLYMKFEDTASQDEYGIGMSKIADSRVKLSTSASTISSYAINRYKNPVYTTVLTVHDELYPIDTIRVGQMIGFRGFGNFADDLVLQIVKLDYSALQVRLHLEELPLSINRAVNALGKSVDEQNTTDTPAVPTPGIMKKSSV